MPPDSSPVVGDLVPVTLIVPIPVARADFMLTLPCRVTPGVPPVVERRAPRTRVRCSPVVTAFTCLPGDALPLTIASALR